MRLNKEREREVSSMRIRRTFSQEFKRQTTEAIVSGQIILKLPSGFAKPEVF